MRFLLLPLLMLIACGKDKEGPDEETTDPDDDTGEIDDTSDPPDPVDLCADEGLTVRDFDPSGASGDFGELVPDFTLQTTLLPWTLSEEWTGCDSYVFINYYGAGDALVQMGSRSDIEDWLETSPLNVHYFFLSYDQTSQIEGVLADVEASVEEALDSMDDGLAAHWRERIHYVTDSAWTADWVGAMNDAYYEDGGYVQWALAIDRFQTAREVGYLCDPATSWQECPPWLISYEPIYFNFESDRQDALDAAGDVTVVPVFEDQPASDGGWAGQRVYADVELPDAATMATFDTMEFDLELACAGYPALTQCPAWDYLVYAHLCDEPAEVNPHAETACQPYVAEVMGECHADGVGTGTACRAASECEDKSGAAWSCDGYEPAIAADTQPGTCAASLGGDSAGTYTCNAAGTGYDDLSCPCNTEIGRWITTYWRPGRWVHDVTPFLALLKDGGTRKISFYTTQYYEVSLDIRLSNQGKGYRPVAMEYLYGGGWFGATYNWGVNHEITETTWTIGSHETDTVAYAISTVDEASGFLTAEEGGDWHRFDWTWSGDALYVCHSAEGLADEAAAFAAGFSCLEDDPKTEEIESGCTGANPLDLATGCGMGAWTTLTANPGGGGPLPWGSWQEIWHADKLPREFTPPAGTTRVEVAAVISGHGFGDTSANCAEFCDHQHEFTVGGGAYTKTHPEAGTLLGCAEQVAIGTVPNQAGTWIYGRGGWCPGLEVPVWRQDVTADVDLGGPNALSYLGLMDGEIWQSTAGNPRIDMVSYLVYYE